MGLVMTLTVRGDTLEMSADDQYRAPLWHLQDALVRCPCEEDLSGYHSRCHLIDGMLLNDSS